MTSDLVKGHKQKITKTPNYPKYENGLNSGVTYLNNVIEKNHLGGWSP